MASNRYANKAKAKAQAAVNENRVSGVAAAKEDAMDVASYMNSNSKELQGEIEQVLLEKIKVNPANDYRELDTDESIQTLADDIARNGLLHNLVVSKRENGDFILLSGERRFRALNKLLESDIDTPFVNVLKENKRVSCRVIKDLTERQEIIRLDAANLQTRGGAGDEKMTRQAMQRYRDNVKAEYNLTEKEAQELLEQVSAVSKTSIYRNLRLMDELSPDLLKLLDNKEISKRDAEELLNLTAEQQSVVSAQILALEEAFGGNEERLSKEKKKALNGYIEAAGASTDRKVAEMLSQTTASIAEVLSEEKNKQEDLPKKETVDIKKKEKVQYREKVKKDCDDIKKKIEKLKKSKVSEIRKIDKENDEKITDWISGLIDELQSFLDEINEGE